jgi:hypothetical protein
MAKNHSHRYVGILATPAERPLLHASAQNPGDKELAEKARMEGLKAFAERIAALCRDCGTEPDAPDVMTTVVLRLAERHVPGFRLDIGSGKKGAPKRPWKNVVRDYWVFSEMTVRIDKGQSIRQAAKHLARNRPQLGSEIALDRRFRRIERDLVADPLLQSGFFLVAEREMTSKIEVLLNSHKLNKQDQQMVKGLLATLRAKKSPEDRQLLVSRIQAATPTIAAKIGR